MRELNISECSQVAGGGVFSYITSAGLFALGLTASFVLTGPAGVAATVALFTVSTGTNVAYDVANSNRENQRVENYDAFGNKR